MADEVNVENWQALAREACRELPTDLSEFVLVKLSAGALTITCGGPNCDGCGADDESIELRWWDTGHARRAAEEDAGVLQLEDANLDAHDGMLRKRLDWAAIAVESTAEHSSFGWYPARMSATEFKSVVQESVCESLFTSGVLAKEDDGSFVRDDGRAVCNIHGQAVKGVPLNEDEEDDEFDDE